MDSGQLASSHVRTSFLNWFSSLTFIAYGIRVKGQVQLINPNEILYLEPGVRFYEPDPGFSVKCSDLHSLDDR